MEPTQETPPIVVTFGNGTPVVGVTFPGREPCLVWNKLQLLHMIFALNRAYDKWDQYDAKKLKEKEDAEA